MTSTYSTERHSLLNRMFPEKRIFVKSDNGTRFVRLGPKQHLLALIFGTVLVLWCLVATSFLVIGLISGEGARTEAALEKRLFEDRLNTLAHDRDQNRMSAIEAQDSFSRALEEFAEIQSDLFNSEIARRELDQSNEALRNILRQTLRDRDTAIEFATARSQAGEDDGGAEVERRLSEARQTLAFMTQALSRTAEDRDSQARKADDVEAVLAKLEVDMHLKQEASDRIFAQLEEAVTLAVKPLDKMFRDVGLPPEQILKQMRRQYSGQGGPLTPIAMSTKSEPLGADELRANSILVDMDQLNLYRLATEKVPFAIPVQANVRSTSGFGYRRDPMGRGTRLHSGQDWAGSYGTPIYASADGVIVHAGWQSGYGRLIKIQHEFGIETRFAHLSKMNVRVGQRVSRGDRIGAMGSSGRSTGTHLHYEVRVGDTPVNPMKYIKAGRDVF